MPVAVTGGLLSMGDAHLAQGDGELDGTAIETSITGEVTMPLCFSERKSYKDVRIVSVLSCRFVLQICEIWTCTFVGDDVRLCVCASRY